MAFGPAFSAPDLSIMVATQHRFAWKLGSDNVDYEAGRYEQAEVWLRRMSAALATLTPHDQASYAPRHEQSTAQLA